MFYVKYKNTVKPTRDSLLIIEQKAKDRDGGRCQVTTNPFPAINYVKSIPLLTIFKNHQLRLQPNPWLAYRNLSAVGNSLEVNYRVLQNNSCDTNCRLTKEDLTKKGS